jgi:hypothetical protein
MNCFIRRECFRKVRVYKKEERGKRKEERRKRKEARK